MFAITERLRKAAPHLRRVCRQASQLGTTSKPVCSRCLLLWRSVTSVKAPTAAGRNLEPLQQQSLWGRHLTCGRALRGRSWLRNGRSQTSTGAAAASQSHSLACASAERKCKQSCTCHATTSGRCRLSETLEHMHALVIKLEYSSGVLRTAQKTATPMLDPYLSQCSAACRCNKREA